ncbi:hypothetical protein HDO35_001899 [Staphylococcus pseudintermedius]|nr:hypothetical protein [Staphylococcus pseudintermedius]HEC2173965.1 YfbU family protein [Staphylococcus delphini]
MKLSKIDRLKLINQYKILKSLSNNEEENKDYDLSINILSEGLEGLYHVFLTEVDEEASKEDYNYTRDVLDFYENLMFSFKEKGIENESLKRLINFKGFDLNDPSQISCLKYAEILMFDLERYTTLKGLCDIENKSDLNSHGTETNKSTMIKYLKNYKQIKKEENHSELYTEEEMKRIFEI